MSENKKILEGISPKIALLSGLAVGIMVVCTIGFVIMSIGFFKNSIKGTVAADDGDELSIKQSEVDYGVPKADQAKAELFVMSYCPYGLQMEKAFLPVMDLLGDKADLSVKFVYYAMHDKKEIDENTLQYCLQKEQKDKFTDYLDCFLLSGDSEFCLKQSGVDEAKLKGCENAADKEFGIAAAYNDKTSWLSGNYPIYPIYAELNQEYGVQGSPTLVINGKVIEGVNRNPEAVKQAVCQGFNNRPEECDAILSNAASSAGFGGGSGQNTSVECGG